MANYSPKSVMETCKEFIHQSEEGWKLMNDIGTSQLHRKLCPASELYEYKCNFMVENSQPAEFLNFCSDLDYLPKWNKHSKSIRTFEGGKCFYWETVFPLPFENRDYVFAITRDTVEYEQHNIQVLKLRSINNYVPEIEGIVRVTDCYQNVCAETDDKCPTTIKVMSYSYVDLKMSIPKWAINFISKVGYPKQHRELLEEFKKYQLNRSKEKNTN